MYINKELKYCQGSDSGKTKPLLTHSEIRELHVGHKDSAVWIFRLKAQDLEVISCIAIFVFKPFYLFHCIYNEENFSFHNFCRSQKTSFQWLFIYLCTMNQEHTALEQCTGWCLSKDE